MIYFIRKIIRAFAAPEHILCCSPQVWEDGLKELKRRTEGLHESGAFLLGTNDGGRRRIQRFVFYDDLDSDALKTGIVIFDGSGYGPLWDLCRREGLTVVADIHVHPAGAYQSESDRTNPMISNKGHIALIVPDLARSVFRAGEIGMYEYIGGYKWNNLSGTSALRKFYIGFWA